MDIIHYRIRIVPIIITLIVSKFCIAQFQNQFQAQTFQQQRFGPNQFVQAPFQRPQQFQQLNNIDSRQSPQQSGVPCPEKNGRFVVPSQCDAYIECVDGIGEQKLCPEGLFFNPEARFNYPCGYPIDINCDGRPNLQPPQPTDDCPHQYGYFKIGDEANCGQFINCADGVGHLFNCPEGLAFNSETYRCDWPDQVPDCNVEAFLKFTCPNPAEGDNQYQLFYSESRFFRNPNDCQQYFICINGHPRLQNCGEGNAFNELINACDSAENVTGCSQPSVISPEPLIDPSPAFRQISQRNRFRQF
ncbi:protein obstructor-E-like [Chelonus insularis]|uniref:protein obstructor-E-like n=1 Tax=Chelonus insularis TaxID=460826 RepID=UPI00158DABE1|nr:protein obstructor-E-like [Chelonus insularis]